MSKYVYPRLSCTDLMTLLADSHICTISENDLKNPKPDFVFDLYTRLLIRFDVLHEQDIGQVDFHALEQFENPDHHLGGIQIMNLFNNVKDLVTAVECPLNFTLKDLNKPDATRTEFFVSAILNSFVYKDMKMNLLGETVVDMNKFDEVQKELEEKISQLNAEIADYNEARERELPFVEEVEAKVKELRQNIATLNSQQMSLRASFRKCKEKSADMDKGISEAEFKLVQATQENANWRSKIVQSPDKLQRALEEKKFERNEAKIAERSAMQSCQDKTTILEVYSKTLKKMSKHLSQLQAINEQVNSAKSIEKERKVLKAKTNDDGVLDKSLDAKLLDWRTKAEQLDESITQLEQERHIKFDAATKELNDAKLDVESKRRDLEARQKKIESVVAQVDAITLEANLIKQSGAAKVQELASKFDELVNQFEQYTESFAASLPVTAV